MMHGFGFPLILLLSPVLIMLLHAVLCRLGPRPPRSPQLLAVRAILLGAFPAAALLWWYGGLSAIRHTEGFGTALLYAFVCYFSLGYTYFHFFNMSETARRIRILNEIEGAGSLDREEIARLYRLDDVIAQRLERLEGAGQLESVDGRYRLGGRLLYLAAVGVSYWRAILGFGRPEQRRR